jgi:hypothetical protein
VLALSRDSQRFAFWVWQAGEALYHFAIWQYLASYSGAKFGLSEDIYAFAILTRVAGLTFFSSRLIGTSLESRSPEIGDTQKSP